MNLISPIATAAGSAEALYDQVMASAMAHLETGIGRFAELRFRVGILFLSFTVMMFCIVDGR